MSIIINKDGVTFGTNTTPWIVPIIGMAEPFIIIATLDSIQNKTLEERIDHNKKLLLWSPFNGVSTILLDQMIRGGLLDVIIRWLFHQPTPAYAPGSQMAFAGYTPQMGTTVSRQAPVGRPLLVWT